MLKAVPAQAGDGGRVFILAWMGDDVEAILLVFAVIIAFVAIVVVLDLKQRGLQRGSSGDFPRPSPPERAVRMEQIIT